MELTIGFFPVQMADWLFEWNISVLLLGSVKELQEYSKLFQSFKTAWNSCRSFLGDQGNMAAYLLVISKLREAKLE